MAEDRPAQPPPDRLSIPTASDIERHVSGGVRHPGTAPEPRDAPARGEAPEGRENADTLTKAGQPGHNR